MRVKLSLLQSCFWSTLLCASCGEQPREEMAMTSSSSVHSQSLVDLPVSALIGGATLSPNNFWPPTGQSCVAQLAGTGNVLQLPPQAYLDECAACHGPTGAGNAKYPNIVGSRALADFTATVRNGKQGPAGESPAFKPNWLDDNDVLRIYAYLTGSPLVETYQCQPKALMGNANVQLAMAAGLQTWRKQDGEVDPRGITNNVACVQCHAPDPLDLAYYGFVDGDLFRRGLHHMPAAQISNIVDMVHAMREKYNLGRRDPLQARPFQPGGALLAGNNIVERDAAFGNELVQMGLSAATRPINSVADANQALAALWQINRHTLRIPVPFDRYSEDIAHNPNGYVSNCLANIDGCDDHGSIADWLPEAPHIPNSFPQYYASMDAYLANPSDTTFNALKRAIPSGDSMPGTYGYAMRDLDHNKYRSLMLANYCLQLEVRGLPGCYDKGTTPFPNQADIWAVGTTVNLFGTGYENYPDCDTHWMSCAAPPARLPQWPAHILADLTPNATLSSNFTRLRHTWMTLWWLHFDPTLLVTGDPTAQKDEYFTRSLFWANNNDWQFDGTPQSQAHPTYAIFSAFEVLMHNVATLANPQLASCKLYPATDFPCTAVDVRSGYYPNVINFAEQNQANNPESSNNVHYQTHYQPNDAARRANYQMLTSNLYRIFFWKLIGSLQQDPWMCRPDIQQLRITRAAQFIHQAETQQANAGNDAQMFSMLQSLLGQARSACPPLQPNP